MCTCLCACLLAAFKSVGMSSLLFCGKPCDTHLLATFLFLLCFVCCWDPASQCGCKRDDYEHCGKFSDVLRANRFIELRAKQFINGCSLLLLAQKHRRSHSVRKSHHIRRHCRLQVEEWEGASTLPTQGGQVGEALVREAAGAKSGLQSQCHLLQHFVKLCVKVQFVLGPVSVVYVLVRAHRQPCVLVCM